MAETIDIQKVPKVEIKYTDVFDVKIPADTELGKKTREFMEFFQQATFKFDVMDPATGKIQRQETTGQDLLKQAKMYCDALAPATATINSPIPILPGGKIPIEAVAGKYNGTLPTGCATMMFHLPIKDQSLSIPIKIQLSEDYLKRANYIGTDGALHPVTIDGVLANELFEACKFKASDLGSINFENIVMVGMGAAQRIPKEASIKTSPEPRANIETLYDKITWIEAPKTLESGLPAKLEDPKTPGKSPPAPPEPSTGKPR